MSTLDKMKIKFTFLSLPKYKLPITNYSMCGSAGVRTRDLILKRDLLYQLSYRPDSGYL